MLPLIVGTIQTKQPFRNTIVDGFLTVLIQLLSDSTNDINEFVRIGNSLWPFYIQPLHPKSISDAIQSLPATDSDESLDRNILGQLGRRFWKYIGKMASELTQLSLDTQHLDGTLVTIPKRPFRIDDMKLPFLRICLLLACFICQNNRAENDRKVFSVHGNGKRRKTRKGNEKEIGEVAFASMGGSLEQLKSLRPRPFLVERVFSIFVTLVRLNPESAPQLPGKKREEYIADALGTTRLYEDLRQLIDLDFIHPVAYSGDVRGEQINLNSAKFWCSLTAQEASFLAEKIAIPLDSYIV